MEESMKMETLESALRRIDGSDVAGALAVARTTADGAKRWLLDRIERGRPAHSDKRNSWWRVPWALTLVGERAAAAAVLQWAENNALTEDGDLRPGAYGVGQERVPVYQLCHLAIAAHLLDRFDLADLIYRRVLTHWNHSDGGAYSYQDHRRGEVDWLLTSQVGLLAVQNGDAEVRDQTFAWFEQMWNWQTRLEETVLITGRDANGVVTEYPGPMNLAVVDLKKPRELYFQPGGAAAFLSEYARQTGSQRAVEIARDLLLLNVHGTVNQLDDDSSVHLCKFAWGAAEISGLDSGVDWTPYLVLMVDWFRRRQEPSGAWSPSAFTLAAPAEDVDRMWKTAEHLMEVSKLETALGARLADGSLGWP